MRPPMPDSSPHLSPPPPPPQAKTKWPGFGSHELYRISMFFLPHSSAPTPPPPPPPPPPLQVQRHQQEALERERCCFERGRCRESGNEAEALVSTPRYIADKFRIVQVYCGNI